MKHMSLAPYRTIIQRLLSQFHRTKVRRHPRMMNRHPDAYATIAQKMVMRSDTTIVTIQRRTAPLVVQSILPMEGDADWRGEVKKQLEFGEGAMGLRELAQYFTN